MKGWKQMALLRMYMTAQIKRYPGEFIRQIIYLVPVFSILLVFVSAQFVNDLNQQEFLDASDFTDIYVSEMYSRLENEFQWIESIDIVTRVEVDGRNWLPTMYPCQIYNMLDKTSYCLDKTYFSKKNLQGIDMNSLRTNEIVLSNNAAASLKVSEGDTVCLMYMDANDDTHYKEYIVGGIMKCAYPYGMDGYGGFALMRSDLDDIENDVEISYCHFTQDQTGDGDILKREQLQECSIFGGMSNHNPFAAVCFFYLGLLLILKICCREADYLRKHMNYTMAVMESLGAERSLNRRLVIGLEGLVLVVSSILAVVLYKFILMERLMSRYIGFRAMLFCITILLCIDVVALARMRRYMIRNWEPLDIVERMKQRD